MIISHIAALSRDSTIGTDGTLPWNLPEDMKFFREKTLGHIIVMGRKTFESFKKPLKNRLHVVITRQKDYVVPEGVHVFSDIKTAFEFCQKNIPHWPSEVFVIGGGEIYNQTLSMADHLYLTLIEQNYPGDTRYPAYNDQFLLAEKEYHPPQGDDPGFSFCLFVKK